MGGSGTWFLGSEVGSVERNVKPLILAANAFRRRELDFWKPYLE